VEFSYCFIDAGKSSHDLIKQLDQPLRKTPVATANAVINLESHVHVHPILLQKLDNVYLEHFRGAAELRIADCFNLHEGSEHQHLFQQYIKGISHLLAKVEKSKDSEATDLQLLGITGALCRLKPLFYPLEGRFCLPLATVSMLEDLKTCVLVDERVVTQVRISPFSTPALASSLTNQTQGQSLVRRSREPYDDREDTRHVCAGLV